MFFMGRKMKIGIASYEDFKQHTISIAKGEIKPKSDEPTIWFQSIESMAQVLSSKNQELLKTIRDNDPKSLTELADISGRKISNLSRTLKTMEKYGIVELKKDGDRIIRPRVCAFEFSAVFEI